MRVNADAKAAIKQIADQFDMTQEAIASRIFSWASRQNRAVQQAILLLEGPEVEKPVAQLVIHTLLQAMRDVESDLKIVYDHANSPVPGKPIISVVKKER